MKISRLVFLWFHVLVILSCKQSKKITPDVSMPADSSGVSSNEQAVSETDGRIFKGLFVVGKSLLSFRECGKTDLDYAVADSTGKMRELYKALFLHSPAFPYEYVYVELNGEMKPADASLQSQGFDSILMVYKVLTFEQKNFQNSCIPYDFWALGDEWSLQISITEGVMVLKDFQMMQVYVFEYFPPINKGDEVFTYSSNNYAMQASIKAVIRKESCADASGNQFQYSASVLLNGKRYQGCAIKGNSVQ